MTDTKSKAKEYVRTSKAMTYILRHGIIERSLTMNEEGFVRVNDLMKQPEMKNVTFDDIKYIVESSDKKRFALKYSDDKSCMNHSQENAYIRANQGHSKDIGKMIDDESLLKKIEEPVALCVHGTDRKSWNQIKEKGLSPMKRKHIHLASGLSNDVNVVSGMRNGAKVIIHIDMKKAIDAGKIFYVSTNGVILTPDVLEPEYFSKVQFV
jgi:2'-phosphotransferase